jgi:hypothetical protein
MTSHYEVYITHQFHSPDGSHGYVGEIEADGRAIANFVNSGNDRFGFSWSSGDDYMDFLREALGKYPISDYRYVVKQYLLDLLTAQEELCT